MHFFKSGVHYELVRYDLSDFATRTRELIEEAKNDPSRLEIMAADALKIAWDRFNILSMLDILAWSMMRAKETANWEVRAPAEEEGWQHYKTFRVHPQSWLNEATPQPLVDNVKRWFESR
jgi:hypothetical protein